VKYKIPPNEAIIKATKATGKAATDDAPDADAKTIEIPSTLIVKQLADLLNVSAIDIIKQLMRNGIMANINQAIDYESAAEVATALGYEPKPEPQKNFGIEMGIITISRGSYSNSVEIAQKLAQKLGYECITREDLLETSGKFNIPEIKLTEDIDNAFSVFDNIKGGKKYYSAFIREAFLERILKDNVIYDGFVGQYFAKGIPNILKVRIITDIDRRIKILMDKKNIDEDSARALLQKIDSERRKWSMSLYCIDSCISELYDLILHIKNLTTDNAVDILYDFAKEPCFQSTPESISRIRDMLSAAKECPAPPCTSISVSSVRCSTGRP